MSNLIEKLTKEERFFQDVDGYYYFDPGKGQGAFMSHNLREIADELDRLNGEDRSKTKSDLKKERDEARAEAERWRSNWANRRNMSMITSFHFPWEGNNSDDSSR